MSERDVKVAKTLGECGVLPSAAQKVLGLRRLEQSLEMNCGTPALDKLELCRGRSQGKDLLTLQY